MTCSDLISTGYDEYACRLTGASVDEDCSGDCIPRKALWYRMGLLPARDIERDERKAVIATASRLRGDHHMYIKTLPTKELLALGDQIADETRRRAAAEQLLPRLEREQTRLDDLIAWAEKRRKDLDRAIDDIRAGKVKDPASLLGSLRAGSRAPSMRPGHPTRRIFTDDKVREIRGRAAAGQSQAHIARSLGAKKPTIQAIVTRRTYADVPDEA